LHGITFLLFLKRKRNKKNSPLLFLKEKRQKNFHVPKPKVSFSRFLSKESWSASFPKRKDAKELSCPETKSFFLPLSF